MATKTTNNKQTIWLSTMMVLSLMLIGYYTVGTPKSNDASTMNVQTDKTKSEDSSKATTAKHTGGNDYFLALETEATQKMELQAQKLTAQANDQKAKPEDQAAAHQQLDRLQQLMQKQTELEDQIVALGFADAVVTGDADKINVMVQADSLDSSKALSIMSLVQKEIQGISVHNIVVGSHK